MMNQAELLKHQAAQDQAQIHNLQLRLANAVARAEKAEAELKALAEQEPIIYGDHTAKHTIRRTIRCKPSKR